MDLAARLGSWSAGPGPLHRKLADALVRAIQRGDLAPGDRLPAERALARDLAVSRSTVVVAYDALQSDGWLERRQGSGTRVRWKAPVGTLGTLLPTGVAGGSGDVIFRRLIEGPGDVVSLACAILPGSPAVVEAAGSFTTAELVGMVDNPGYMPLGLPVLRREVAALLTRAGLPSTEAEVMITTGAQQAINLAACVLVRPGDEVLVENPSFSGCLDALRSAGARLVPMPMDGDGIDVNAVEAAVDGGSPVALYVMPTYHNPTGALLSAPRRRRLAQLAAERGLIVIEDNALEHARFGTVSPPPPVGSYAPPGAPVLTVGSLSKVLWAGLRIGWVRANEALIARLVQAKVLHDLGSPVLPQAVAARLLPRLEEIGGRRGKEQGEHVARAVALLQQHLPDWTWQTPAGGLALWVRLPQGDGSEFAQVALRHGVEVVPGATMSPDGSFADHLRLAVIEPPLLDEAFVRLGRAWAAYAPSPAARSDVRVIV